MRVLFLGTDEVAVPTLRLLYDSMAGKGEFGGLVRSLDVICPGPRPIRRRGKRYTTPTPVHAFSHSHFIPTHLIPHGLRRFRDWDGIGAEEGGLEGDGKKELFGGEHDDAFDVGVVVSFGYMVGAKVRKLCKDGILLNMHPSLLPRFRGASPIISTILEGDHETGVSVQLLHPTVMDGGDVLSQERVRLDGQETCDQLTATLADIGAHLTLDTLRDLPTRLQHATPQDPSSVTSCSTFSPQHGHITPTTTPALTIDRTFRALSHKFPIYTHITAPSFKAPKKLTLKEIKLPATAGGAHARKEGHTNDHPSPPTTQPQIPPGRFLVHHRSLLLGTATTPIEVAALQIGTGPVLSGLSWAKGGVKEVGEVQTE